jgi:23S rRNA (uridine2552-2'-O)-methyltransferase
MSDGKTRDAGTRTGRLKVYRLHTKLKSSSNQWIRRHLNDAYVHQAADLGYRCRSAFKLIELDDKFHLFAPGMTVLDLGCAPGGWSQVASQRICAGPKGLVVGIDRDPMAPLPHVTFFQGDILEDPAHDFLEGQSFQVILSDMAPSLTGHAPTDRLQMEALMEMVWHLAQSKLASKGCIVMKAFHGLLRDQMAPFFSKIFYAKPDASRRSSREIYLVALGFKGVPAATPIHTPGAPS